MVGISVQRNQPDYVVEGTAKWSRALIRESNLPYPPRTIRQEAGYIRQRAPGGIIILRIGDSRPETINAWYDDCLRLMAGWQPARQMRYLHDIRGAGLPTPYATDRVAQVLQRMRQIPVSDGRGAILVTNLTLARLLESVIKRRPRTNWHIRCMADEHGALAWLRG